MTVPLSNAENAALVEKFSRVPPNLKLDSRFLKLQEAEENSNSPVRIEQMVNQLSSGEWLENQSLASRIYQVPTADWLTGTTLVYLRPTCSQKNLFKNQVLSRYLPYFSGLANPCFRFRLVKHLKSHSLARWLVKKSSFSVRYVCVT